MDALILRNIIIAKARNKYIPSYTKNISKALVLYLTNDASKKEQIPLRISTKNKPKNWIDKSGRPQCPNCNFTLGLRVVSTPKDPKLNKFGWNSCWECLNCGYEKYSKKTIQDWSEELKKKDS